MTHNLTSGYTSKRKKISILKIYLHPHVYWSIIHNNEDMENNLSCPNDLVLIAWIKKLWCLDIKLDCEQWTHMQGAGNFLRRM